LIFLGLAVFMPFLRGIFSFDPLHPWELGLVAVASLASILIAESVKLRVFGKLFRLRD
jgi:hypothetical protein